MILKAHGTSHREGFARPCVLLKGGLRSSALHIIKKHAHTVQPMFHLIALDHEPQLIEPVRMRGTRLGGGGDERIEGTGSAFWIGTSLWFEGTGELEFRSAGTRLASFRIVPFIAFLNQIFDARVAVWFQFPFEGEFKRREFLHSADILQSARQVERSQQAVLNFPCGRERLAGDFTPRRSGLAIKERSQVRGCRSQRHREKKRDSHPHG